MQREKQTTFSRFQEFDAAQGSLHRRFRTIHVGGTNGKGSVALKIAKALEFSGYKVGLYTSPHLVHFEERIRINGVPISKERAENMLETIFSLSVEGLSFFDLTTFLAFSYFAEERVDFGVIEVGMGGRLDATNVILPEVSIVTGIGRDHVRFLGDTLEKIAKEKEGICKKGVPFIVGLSAIPFFPHAIHAPCHPHPFYDEENRQLARFVLEFLSVKEEAIQYGEKYRPSGRFECHENAVIDCAHNVQGIQRLVDALRYFYPEEKFHFLTAFTSAQKESECHPYLEPIAKKITPIKSEHPLLSTTTGVKMKDAVGSLLGYREVICGSCHIFEEIQRVLGEKGRLIHRL